MVQTLGKSVNQNISFWIYILLPTSNTTSLCSSLKSKYYSIFEDLAHIFKFFRNLKFRQILRSVWNKLGVYIVKSPWLGRGVFDSNTPWLRLGVFEPNTPLQRLRRGGFEGIFCVISLLRYLFQFNNHKILFLPFKKFYNVYYRWLFLTNFFFLSRVYKNNILEKKCHDKLIYLEFKIILKTFP